MSRRYEVCIIGGGYLGCLIAREMSRYEISCVLLEAENDFCQGIAKANTAVLYAGYDNRPGTLKSRLTVQGNTETARLCAEFGIPLQRRGSLMVGIKEASRKVLEKKLYHGQCSQVPDLRIMERDELRETEPELAECFSHALWSGTTGTFYPWELGIAAGTQARDNGVDVLFSCEVTAIVRDEKGYCVEYADKGAGEARTEALHTDSVINCAGIRSDVIREMLLPPNYRIFPTKAEYLLYPEPEKTAVSHIIFYEPDEGGKGISLVPNRNGTLLAGPCDLPFNGGYSRDTTPEGMDFVRRQAEFICPSLTDQSSLGHFGIFRPNPGEVFRDDNGVVHNLDRDIHSFLIEQPEDEPRFISLLGIKTPGITAGVPIASYVKKQLFSTFDRQIRIKEKFGKASRLYSLPVNQMSLEQKKELALRDPAFGVVVCQCEQITEGEIREAIRSGARTLEGVKRRCGAQFGLCQGSRCRKTIEKLLKQYGHSEKDIQIEEVVSIPENMTSVKGSYSAKCSRIPERVQPEDILYDVLLVGAGMAGMALAAELKRQEPGLSVLVLESKDSVGGVLNQCSHEGFRRMSDGQYVSGTVYEKELEERFMDSGAKVLTKACVTAIDSEILSENEQILTCTAACGDQWKTYKARKIVLTCGALERPVGMLDIPGGRPEGIYSAGEIQYRINVDKAPTGHRAVVLGAGNMGLIVAGLLQDNHTQVVGMVEQSHKVTANPINRDKYLKADPWPLWTNARISRIHGENKLTGVSVTDCTSGKIMEIPCDMLVVAAGLMPDQKLLCKASQKVRQSGQIYTFGNCDKIYAVVDTICKDARKMAEKLIGGRKEGDHHGR